MTAELEDRFREVLRDRSGDVVRPDNWDARLLTAGRRRLSRRRAGTVAGAVIAVVAVLLAGGVLIPGTLSGVEPARPADKRGSIEPDKLPFGKLTTTAHATRAEARPTTVFFGEHEWKLGNVAVDDAVNAGEGVLATVKTRSGYQLMFHGADGTTKSLALGDPRYAVSPDGARIAWVDNKRVPDVESDRADLVLSELPSGRVLRTMPLDLTAAAWEGGRPEVHGFLGDRVIVTSPWGKPLVWDPDVRQLRPLINAPQDRDWMPAGVSDVTESALFIDDATSCVHSLALAGQGTREQWRRCDLGDHSLRLKVSPDGRTLMAVAGDTIAILDMATGSTLWSRTLAAGINWSASFAERWIVSGVRIDEHVWESPEKLLVSYTTGRLWDGSSLLRCDIRQRVCERVPTKDGALVFALGNVGMR